MKRTYTVEITVDCDSSAGPNKVQDEVRKKIERIWDFGIRQTTVNRMSETGTERNPRRADLDSDPTLTELIDGLFGVTQRIADEYDRFRTTRRR